MKKEFRIVDLNENILFFYLITLEKRLELILRLSFDQIDLKIQKIYFHDSSVKHRRTFKFSVIDNSGNSLLNFIPFKGMLYYNIPAVSLYDAKLADDQFVPITHWNKRKFMTALDLKCYQDIMGIVRHMIDNNKKINKPSDLPYRKIIGLFNEKCCFSAYFNNWVISKAQWKEIPQRLVINSTSWTYELFPEGAYESLIKGMCLTKKTF
jgi:hypothetical protein